jgi:hypothetical protein
MTKLYADVTEFRCLFLNKENEGDCVLTSDFPLLLLCGLFLLSFCFFRHYSSLKLDFDVFYLNLCLSQDQHTLHAHIQRPWLVGVKFYLFLSLPTLAFTSLPFSYSLLSSVRHRKTQANTGRQNRIICQSNTKTRTRSRYQIERTSFKLLFRKEKKVMA